MNKTIVIIDGNSLINRAYFAMFKSPMITKDGMYTQGIFGFLNMLHKIMDDYNPSYMAVAWDRKAPTFRHEQYSDYKAGRKKMPMELAMELQPMKDILTAMHIQNLELDGYEADDIIGTIARKAEAEGLEPLIITGDKDALQLATDVTKVLITKKGITEFDLYDAAKMEERYELTPTQFIDLKGLMGDSSDNIPGIPGIGEKTGIKLLKQFGSVANLLAHTDEIKNAKQRQKVEENAQLAAMSRDLAEINTNVPLDIDIQSFAMQEPDYDTLVELYTKLEFRKFLEKLQGQGIQLEVVSEVSEKEYPLTFVQGEGDFADLEALAENSILGIYVFGDNNHVETSRVDGISLLTESRGYYLEGEWISSFVTLAQKKRFRYWGHNLVEDYYMMLQLGISALDTHFDIQVGAYILDPSKSKYDLKTLVFDNLHRDILSEKEALEQASQMDLLGRSTSTYGEYGLDCLRATEAIMRMQKKTIKENGQGQLCDQIELPLIEVLANMEADGVHVDRAVLLEIGQELEGEISTLEAQIYDLAGETFNINSPIQLGTILFEKLELPAGKKTKRGYSTSADILEKIQDKHPIVPLVLSYRTLTKLNSTYVIGLTGLIGSDQKIHAHFQQTVAATGRLSCTEPNLQNIPIRYEAGRALRKAFVAPEGYRFIGADYSQIELRVLAHLSQDENLISAFNNGDDIHRMTASRVFDIPFEDVTSLDRSRAKAVNFGVIYGMSGFGLSEELHITRKQADAYIKDYFAKHEAVKAYMDGEIAQCKEKGFTQTIFGRRRYIHEINSSNFMTRQLGERLAMNSPIQGVAADIMKIAMNRVFRELQEKNLKTRLLLQIHDELILCAPEEEREEVQELLLRNMEDAADLAVSLTCDLNVGASWYDLKD